jgi:hypothetical protein
LIRHVCVFISLFLKRTEERKSKNTGEIMEREKRKRQRRGSKGELIERMSGPEPESQTRRQRETPNLEYSGGVT